MTRRISFDDVLRACPPDSVALVEQLVSTGVRSGARLFLVGGPVRDLLLKRPIRDVDLLIEGGDLGQAQALAARGTPEGARIVSHERFGTVHVDWGGASLDLASSRTEVYPRPGALPRVESASLEADLRRRDFTVNALAIRLTPEEPKNRMAVMDGGTGLQDLAAGELRILHDDSFHDDPTRAIRAARFAARLGFSVSRRTGSQLRAALRDGAFGAVSGERFGRELRMLFADAALGMNPVDALRRLDGWGVLPVLEPGLLLPRESVAPLRRLGKLIFAPSWRGPRARPWVAGFCLWLAPLSPALRRRALKRFAVRGEVAEKIMGFAKQRDSSLRTLGRVRGRGAVDRALSELDEERLLALCASAAPAVRRRIERWAAEDRGRRIPVGGNDLVAMGASGAAVGRSLARVREAYLDGEVVNREEGLALAREIVRRRREPSRQPASRAEKA
jgi:tRNA nucleotidyltransferase (CCA-adding enzyme)